MDGELLLSRSDVPFHITDQGQVLFLLRAKRTNSNITRERERRGEEEAAGG